MWHRARASGIGWRCSTPGSNANQVSALRLVNLGEEIAEVTIAGFDDKGMSPGGAVTLTVPAGGSVTHTAAELETGNAEGLEGSLGDGAGKWRLTVNADQPISAMSLLSSPTGHLTNLSTAPERGAGPVETASEAHEALVSPTVQSKCINCHVEGGVSGNTRLVFVRDTDADYLAKNLKVFEDYLEEVEDGAERLLDKIQGALAHGGGAQVAAGTEQYRGFQQLMEFLGVDVEDAVLTDLFEGVTLESSRRTLWRAAIMFAGRIPTAAEYAKVESGTDDDLRRAIRDLMEGPGFHEFLIRGANDRLLTDRETDAGRLFDEYRFFVDYINKLYDLNVSGAATGDPDPARRFETGADYGAARAPLELIAYVAENDLPYTEILTADYVMANPYAAEAYGAPTTFTDPDDVHEFRPSAVVRYFPYGHRWQVEETETGFRIPDPGPAVVRWPHAGVLNTKAFLQRYPTTATNRNRARSRWIYYHFLGLDIEKSESRTMDPEVLKDTNNPTLNNPKCTACHVRMDPVAGAFQNYGDEGFYRDQWGGHDSLDEIYREPPGTVVEITAESWSAKQTIVLREKLTTEDGLFFTAADNEWGKIALDRLEVRDLEGTLVYEVEFEDPEAGIECPREEEFGCGGVGHNPETGNADHWVVWGWLYLPLPVDVEGDSEIEIEAWASEPGRRLRVAVTPYKVGDTWYRDMREPGFGDEVVPDEYRDNSLQWLARRIVADERFAEATVKFWWPAIMGSKVAEQPEDGDADYGPKKLAADAQRAEVRRLSHEFRLGFGWSDANPYNLKDLLVEIVLSPWFRSSSSTHDMVGLHAAALRNVGARRLLTPEELARKTAAVTGYQWGRGTFLDGEPRSSDYSALTDDNRYRLLYGGIDSAGITQRARDMTAVMAGVARAHAMEASCPIVLRELYLLPENGRRLFVGFDRRMSPVTDFRARAEVKATSWADRETVSVRGSVSETTNAVSLVLAREVADGMLRLDSLSLRVPGSSEEVSTIQLEDLTDDDLESPNCGQAVYNDKTGYDDHWGLWRTCRLRVPVDIPEGMYDVEVVAWADQADGESMALEISVESDTETSAGSKEIRSKLVELNETLFGIRVEPDSAVVDAAYDLFVDAWERKKQSAHLGVLTNSCDFWEDFEYFDGILEGAVSEEGWNYDAVNEFIDGLDKEDISGSARAWITIIARMLMDYRYLYL